MAETKKMPPLPAGSVDGDALEKAAAKSGADLEKAVAEAVVRKTEPNPVSEKRQERLSARVGDVPTDGLDPPAGEATKQIAEPTSNFVRRDKPGGWHEITGPGLTEPFRTQDKDEFEAKWAELTGGDAEV